MKRDEYKKLYREYRIYTATLKALCDADKPHLVDILSVSFWDSAEHAGTWGKLLRIADVTWGHPEQVMSPNLEWRLKQYKRGA